MNFHNLIQRQYTLKHVISWPQTYTCLSRLSSHLSTNFTENQTSSEVTTTQRSIPDKLYKTIEIEARSADREVLNSYETFVKLAANGLDVSISRTWEPFRKIIRRTLLRSAFVKKKYRVQYEFRTYFRSIEFQHLTASTADTLLEYIERNLPEGVALKVYKTSIESLPEHISHDIHSTVDPTQQNTT